MGLFSKDIKNLDDLFVHTLRDIYYTEKQLVKSLPALVEKANDPGLTAALSSHLEQTRGHVDRLEQVFDLLGEEAKTIHCPAIDGIIEEANEILGDAEDKNVVDAAIIAAAQAVEHYETTRYGSLATWAKQLGRDDCAALLHETLEEEKAADVALTECAELGINARAA